MLVWLVRSAHVLALVSLLFAGCGHGGGGRADGRQPTCVVLSVGGAAAIAHVGALMALQEARVPIACIGGNSMGALVAGLYATAPEASLPARFDAFAAGYRAETEKDAVETGALAGGLAALFAAALTGGATLPMLAAGASGFMLGVDGTPKVDRDRVVVVLDRLFGGATIERLSVPYVTFYQQQRGDGLVLVDARNGNLAQAIGKSIANPFIFRNLDVVDAGQIDPGGDRVAMTPVYDACRVFPGRRIIALNVTGQPAFVAGSSSCPLQEIMIETGPVDGAAIFRGDRAELRRVIELGWRAAAGPLGLPPTPPGV
jgi:NTE family protein